MLQIAIIESQPSVSNVLRKTGDHCSPYEIVGEAYSKSAGVAMLNCVKPDVVFLDNELTDGQGLDMLSMFPNRTFKVVLFASTEAYALKAIRAQVYDYLLKPVDPEYLCHILKALQTSPETGRSRQKNETYTSDRVFVITTAEKTHFIHLDEIIYCKSDKGYTTIFLEKNRHILVSKTLKELETLIGAAPEFIRVHQSWLVNTHNIKSFDGRNGGTLELKSGLGIPVSSRKRTAVLSQLAGRRNYSTFRPPAPADKISANR